MRADDASSDTAARPWPGTVTATVGMTERGLVLGEDVLLAKMASASAFDADRVVAMLSVAAGRPLPSAAVLPPRPSEIYDLKTGSAILSEKRIKELRDHLPDNNNVVIHEVRP